MTPTIRIPLKSTIWLLEVGKISRHKLKKKKVLHVHGHSWLTLQANRSFHVFHALEILKEAEKNREMSYCV